MATWSDFTGYVDSYLARLTPEALSLVRQYGQSGGNTAMRQKAADTLVAQLGMTNEQAMSLMVMYENVVRRGDRDVSASADGAGNVNWGTGEQRLMGREAFTSDADYQAYIKKLFGLEGVQAPDAPGAVGETDDVTNRINKFLADLDPNSPQTQAMYQYIQKRGQATQGAASARAGLGSVGSGQGGGGLSAYGQQMVQGDLANKYDLQRKSLQAQGVGLLNQRDLGLKGLEQGYMQMQNKQAEQAWAAKQNQAQGIGAAIGGGLGALGFIGGPALGAATMAGGAALGGGLGGLATGGSGPSYPSMPSWMSGSGRKGSLGGSGY